MNKFYIVFEYTWSTTNKETGEEKWSYTTADGYYTTYNKLDSQANIEKLKNELRKTPYTHMSDNSAIVILTMKELIA